MTIKRDNVILSNYEAIQERLTHKCMMSQKQLKKIADKNERIKNMLKRVELRDIATNKAIIRHNKRLNIPQAYDLFYINQGDYITNRLYTEQQKKFYIQLKKTQDKFKIESYLNKEYDFNLSYQQNKNKFLMFIKQIDTLINKDIIVY